VTITAEQRKQIREHLGTFPFVSDALADRMTECATDFYIGKPSVILWNLFAWCDTPEGYDYWYGGHVEFEAQENPSVSPKPKELTQADVQTLLSILRGELECTTSEKEQDKRNAASYWKDCDKTSPYGISAFRWFSAINASHKRMKQREKTLVGLITKLKGLR
jgi:hypothetical protein